MRRVFRVNACALVVVMSLTGCSSLWRYIDDAWRVARPVARDATFTSETALRSSIDEQMAALRASDEKFAGYWDELRAYAHDPVVEEVLSEACAVTFDTIDGQPFDAETSFWNVVTGGTERGMYEEMIEDARTVAEVLSDAANGEVDSAAAASSVFMFQAYYC